MEVAEGKEGMKIIEEIRRMILESEWMIQVKVTPVNLHVYY
jgi:hypothetical protein